MEKANSPLAVLPIPQKHLTRYKKKKGVFIIRLRGTVLYVGASTSMYKAIMRLFQKGGVLSEYDCQRCMFEIIETQLRSPSVESVLKRQFAPKYNSRFKVWRPDTYYEKKQAKKIWNWYLEQSRFDQANHRTDLNNA